MQPVAITGLGLVCALGHSAPEVWPRLVAGIHGFGPISRFDASTYAARVAAEVRDVQFAPAFPSDDANDSVLRRGTRLFVAAASEAWRDAGLGRSPRSGAAGVAAGASVNYLHMGHLRGLWECRDDSGLCVDRAREQARRVMPPGSFLRRQGEALASAAGLALGLTGPRLCVDTACASGAHAIIDAARAVARGDAPVMVAGGGAGLIVPLTVLAFSRIGALSTNHDPASASRPFDRRRDGFVLGEGAAAVVLEPIASARARRAPVYAEIVGAATTVNARSLTDPSPDGETEAATIALALGDAGLTPDAVDYVAAHGTSTPRNDVAETRAIVRALGPRARSVAVSSNKGQLGHTLAAAGAVNAVVAALALATQVAPPTAHLETPDPECSLDYVPHIGRPTAIGAALAHAFAFGGQNAVIVLRRPALADRRDLGGPAVTGIEQATTPGGRPVS